MKEETVKKLMHKSLESTSAGFMEGLMEKVKTIKKQEKARSSPFWIILFATIFLGIVVSFLLFRMLDLPNGSMGYGRNTWRIPVFVMTTLFLLYGIDHILNCRNLEKNS